MTVSTLRLSQHPLRIKVKNNSSLISLNRHPYSRNGFRQQTIHICQALEFDYQSLVSGITNPGQVDGVASLNAAQTVIGLLGVSFVLTFFVAPNFKSAFKEEETWQEIYPKLKEQGVNSISPQDVKNQLNKGVAVVDVRLARKFENGGINGSINVPLYQPISGMGIAANVRRAGFAFFGIYGTERNLGFLEEMESKFSKDEAIIVVCEGGGSIETKPGVSTGFQSQSLKAVYELQKAGFKKVSHLKGGLRQWAREIEDLVFPEEMTFPESKKGGSLLAQIFGR
eukprot:TRINITY_DN1610_c0_g1_i2.p2 TRINITY_DN1610_c0_g1~~TRINITY_DN1610_c0_g1_i2.p2  ORF type:complete len:283 (-),score=36.36 TRINITY_DN1610_c0_g1_i2:1087-1935(-)